MFFLEVQGAGIGDFVNLDLWLPLLLPLLS